MPRSALLPDHTGPHRRCGFSAKIIEILNSNSVSYDTFDILQDEEVSHPLCARGLCGTSCWVFHLQVRQGLKEFSNWPTFPQLYYKGTLLGGLDIIQVARSFEST